VVSEDDGETSGGVDLLRGLCEYNKALAETEPCFLDGALRCEALSIALTELCRVKGDDFDTRSLTITLL
jgi:hypothetical protein